MINKVLLSIITVVKNCAETLPTTLSSVAEAKKENIEYIVIDGASTDATLEVVLSQNHLVDLIISEPDTGIYNAMNKGVNLARGRYVLFVNGDDALVAEGFPSVIDAMTHGRDQIICATTLVEDATAPHEVLIPQPCRLPFFNSIPHPSSFVNRELLIRWPFREDLRIAADYDFFLRAYLSGQSFQVLPAVTALHHRGGASGDIAKSQAEVELVRREHLGWRYPLYNGVASLYRLGKRLAHRSRVG